MKAGEPARAAKAEPFRMETLAMAVVAMALAAAVIAALDSYSAKVLVFGDNRSYLAIATAIRTLRFEGLEPYHFWGLPYVVAVASVITRSVPVALVLVSALASIGTIALAWRLWGGAVAALLAIASSDWIQRSTLGGAEPLFMSLLLASFFLARQNRWALAAFAAALATTVRPVGALALAALGIVLLKRRDWRNVVTLVVAAGLVASAYLLAQRAALGDFTGSYRHYQQWDWSGTSPLGFPFVAIVHGAVEYHRPLSNAFQISAWVLLTGFAGWMVITRPQARARIQSAPVEAIFAALYAAFLVTYNAPKWAWLEFPRFVVPLLPFAFLALTARYTPSRGLLWAGTLVGGLFAGASAVGVVRVLHLLAN